MNPRILLAFGLVLILGGLLATLDAQRARSFMGSSEDPAIAGSTPHMGNDLAALKSRSERELASAGGSMMTGVARETVDYLLFIDETTLMKYPCRDRSALSLGDRQSIVEILRDTKNDLPQYFQNVIR